MYFKSSPKLSFVSYAFIFTALFSFAISAFFWSFHLDSANAQLADAVAVRETELRAELDRVLRDIDAQQEILKSEQQKGQTLARDVAILNAQIQQAKLKVKARQIAIEGLGKDITQKTQTINHLTGKIDDTRDSLGQLMRKTNEIDDFTLSEVVLSDKDISEFFADIDAYDSIQKNIQVALEYIRQSKIETESARQTLDKRRLEEIDAKAFIEAEKATIEKNEKEKARLLSLSKEQQKNYSNDIRKKESRAAEIRSALFNLRDTSAIPFSKALEYATLASEKTGVRPAFLLATFKQESDYGKNVGACYMTNLTNGDGIKINTGLAVEGIMKPSRDIQPFISITSALGRDPVQTKVSCPMGTGYGGAMGPAQFIPSTWVLFEARVAKALGKTSADPWEPRDAFMASSIYHANNGADLQTYSAERNAACRYYSGSNCPDYKKNKTKRDLEVISYGNSVMAKAKIIQEDIDIISPVSGS